MFKHRFTLALCALVLSAPAARADQDKGRIEIDDSAKNTITAKVTGGTVQLNRDIRSDPATPHVLEFSIDIDGSITEGTGVGVLLDPGKVVSDILSVTLTQRTRGQGIKYYTASGSFTSDSAAGLPNLGNLGLDAATQTKIIGKGLLENGQFQDMSGILINTADGSDFSIGGLTVMALSAPVPEPESTLLLCAGLALLALSDRVSRRKSRG